MKILFLILSINFFTVQAFAKNEGKQSIPLNVEVSVTKKGLAILKKSDSILSDESIWNKKDNRKCSRHDKKWSLYCSFVKASMELSGEFDHRMGVLEELRRTIVSYTKNKKYEHRLMDFNNDPLVKFGDIKKVISLTIKRVGKRFKSK